jgi:hypothetical protein
MFVYRSAVSLPPKNECTLRKPSSILSEESPVYIRYVFLSSLDEGLQRSAA